jgi:hypothetical protein
VLSDQEKFKNVLDKMSKTDAFKKLKKIRDACEESDKEKVYKAGQQMGKSIAEKIIDPLGLGIVQTTKQADPTLATIQMLRYKNNSLKWLKALCPPQTFETTMRFLVQLWLLDTPKKVTPEKMLEDLKSDTKSVNMKMTALEIVANIVPWMKPLAPLIAVLKQYVKKLGETSVQSLMTKGDASTEVTAPEAAPQEKTAKKAETVLASQIKESAALQEVLATNTPKKDVVNADTKPTSEQQQQVRNENKGSAGIGKDPAIEFSKN